MNFRIEKREPFGRTWGVKNIKRRIGTISIFAHNWNANFAEFWSKFPPRYIYQIEDRYGALCWTKVGHLALLTAYIIRVYFRRCENQLLKVLYKERARDKAGADILCTIMIAFYTYKICVPSFPPVTLCLNFPDLDNRFNTLLKHTFLKLI